MICKALKFQAFKQLKHLCTSLINVRTKINQGTQKNQKNRKINGKCSSHTGIFTIKFTLKLLYEYCSEEFNLTRV